MIMFLTLVLITIWHGGTGVWSWRMKMPKGFCLAVAALFGSEGQCGQTTSACVLVAGLVGYPRRSNTVSFCPTVVTYL